MQKMFFVIFALMIISFSEFYSYELSDYYYKGKSSMIMDLTDETVISSFLDSGNYDEVFCAIRRVGELKLTNVKGKVESWSLHRNRMQTWERVLWKPIYGIYSIWGFLYLVKSVINPMELFFPVIYGEIRIISARSVCFRLWVV